MRGVGSAQGTGEMPGVDADGLPVAGHGRLVPAPLELGAMESVRAEIQQGIVKGEPSDWRKRPETRAPGMF